MHLLGSEKVKTQNNCPEIESNHWNWNQLNGLKFELIDSNLKFGLRHCWLTSNATVGVIWLPAAAVHAMAKVIPTDPDELGTKEELINSITLKCQALGIWWRNWRSEVAYANFNRNKFNLIQRCSKQWPVTLSNDMPYIRHLCDSVMTFVCTLACRDVGWVEGKNQWSDEWRVSRSEERSLIITLFRMDLTTSILHHGWVHWCADVNQNCQW